MDFEKLGSFYLGSQQDPSTHTTGEPVMYDARDLTTHAVCVGMTGSGKTGLCLAMLEEALIDGVPVLAIDPKGDIGNLMLTFPALAASDFAPWVDPAEAARSGISIDELAARTATRWREGLSASGQSPERIARLRAAGEVAIYTPGSDAGIPLSVLASFRAPPAELAGDGEAWRDRVEGAVSGLLGLVGIQADPLRSREHVLLSQLLDRGWREGKDVELAALVHGVMRPPFAQVGAFDLETFFPANDRTQLALALNTLLASPSFAAWTVGAPLDIPSLLFTPAGKPRIAVLSIAHLGDAERMFFVTLLLQEVITWMRTQAGTSSLRALVFMDEVTGYLPPTATPPSKKPMMTLLKQARAFGVGMVLATQNPVDVDYKALSNAGTWFLGRLQTERDKARVIEGLEGASAAAGKKFDKAAMEVTLSGLASRVFVMNNVHDDHPIVFQTRFVMSYLAGPLTRTQIQRLMAPVKASAPARVATTTTTTVVAPTKTAATSVRPIAPGGLDEMFAAEAELGPALLGVAKVHYAQASANIDVWHELTIVAPLAADAAGDLWEHALVVDPRRLTSLDSVPASGAAFAALPRALDSKMAGKLKDALEAWIYRAAPLTLWAARALDLTSTPEETEAAFRARVAIKAREERDAAVAKLKAKYQPKLDALATRQRAADQRVDREQAQSTTATADSAITIGASVLGALFGSRKSAASKVASAARSVSHTAGQRGDVTRAKDAAAQLAAQRADIETQLASDLVELQARPDPEVVAIELTAKNADTAVTRVALLWLPV
ncbi:ATP-binding protein [soil metagenome]